MDSIGIDTTTVLTTGSIGIVTNSYDISRMYNIELDANWFQPGDVLTTTYGWVCVPDIKDTLESPCIEFEGYEFE
jgi:hypothetical protein